MRKFEAKTLPEVYKLALLEMNCSILELEIEVLQRPSKGLLGLGSKNAIIVAKKIVKDEKAKKSVEVVEDPPLPIEVEEMIKEHEHVPHDHLVKKIEEDLKTLFAKSCFSIDVIEVDVFDQNAFIFLDGEDAALLIGKEGYRYNALSYMIFNWIYSKYDLFLKLEIASFLTSQEQMVEGLLKPIIAKVEAEGRARTRVFDGILVQIALEKLRDYFPNKYIAAKTNQNGEKYIIINDFLSNSNE
ncbi:MAG: Jag N-terminal domain-containing protein [Campylobacterales bacterium]|nr:Jag N-terminal domain-containing protein [Campylobacterales bacterium]